MKISDVRLQKYDLKLVRPIIIKGHTLENRTGLILSLIDSVGRTGYGEIAPLPFLHKETMDEAAYCIFRVRKTLLEREIQNETASFTDPIEEQIGTGLPPSVSFGVEMALFDLLIQKTAGQGIFSGLKVPVCGLTSADSEGLYTDLREMLERGFTTVKIKVGSNSIAQDADRIKASKKIIQNKMKLRLDANRSWTLEEAITFCERMGPGQIDYIEEPVHRVCDQKAFVNGTGIPLALDETLLEKGIGSVSDLGHVGAFVIKPGLTGGLRHTADLIDIARSNNIMPVLSSSFQSGLAIRAIFLFAGERGLSDIPAGLDTLKWFTEDCLAHRIPVVNGSVNLQQLLEQRPCFNERLLVDS